MYQLSDHQMFFINIENIAKIDKVSKYIEVEKSDEISLQNQSQSQTIANDISAPWSFDKYFTNKHNLFFCFTQIEPSIVTNIIHKLKINLTMVMIIFLTSY